MDSKTLRVTLFLKLTENAIGLVQATINPKILINTIKNEKFKNVSISHSSEICLSDIPFLMNFKKNKMTFQLSEIF